MNNSGFEYNPLTDGEMYVYWLASMTGYYRPDHILDSWGLTYKRNVATSFSATAGVCRHFFGNEILYGSYNHEISTPATPINPATTLYVGVGIDSKGVPYLGETVNPMGVIMPREAIITKNPKVGEVIEERSKVYGSCDAHDLIHNTYHWRYQTTAIYSTWGGFANVVRTDLHEYNTEIDPSKCDMVYSYFFAENIGIVALYWGVWDGTFNTPNGLNPNVIGHAIGLIQQ